MRFDLWFHRTQSRDKAVQWASLAVDFYTCISKCGFTAEELTPDAIKEMDYAKKIIGKYGTGTEL